MKAAELRKLSLEELKDKLAAARKGLFNLRFQHAVGQLEKKSRLKEQKKEITRILTVMTELGA